MGWFQVLLDQRILYLFAERSGVSNLLSESLIWTYSCWISYVCGCKALFWCPNSSMVAQIIVKVSHSSSLGVDRTINSIPLQQPNVLVELGRVPTSEMLWTRIQRVIYSEDMSYIIYKRVRMRWLQVHIEPSIQRCCVVYSLAYNHHI